MAENKAKMKKCKICGESYKSKFSSFQKTCNEVECMVAWGQQIKTKKHKAETRVIENGTR